MNPWTPTVGELACVVTRHHDQWTEARRVKVTDVLKTKIKTDGGDFSLKKMWFDGFEQYEAVYGYAVRTTYLTALDSETAGKALRAVAIARNVRKCDQIGRTLSSLPLNGEGAEAVVADAIEQLRCVRFDFPGQQS